MGHEPRMAPLRAVLKDQPRKVVIEAVYQIGIILSHALTRKRFLARMKADAKLDYQRKATAKALDMLTVLQRAEGRTVTELSPEVRNSYLMQLGELIPPDESPTLISEADIEAALQELREFV
jgi:hypothetical protein